MLTFFLKLNRKLLITVLLTIVLVDGGEYIMNDNFVAAAESPFWNAWKVNAVDDVAAGAALLECLVVPENSTAVVLDETKTRPGGYEYSCVGVNAERKDGSGYYAFQTVLNKDYETVFPIYSGDELNIYYDERGQLWDFTGLTFTGIIGGRLIGLYVSDNDLNTFVAHNFNEQPDKIYDNFITMNFTDTQSKSLKDIFTSAESKNITFTLLIENESADDLLVGGFFDLWPRNVENAPTPEPATLAIFGLGLAGLGLCRRLWQK